MIGLTEDLPGWRLVLEQVGVPFRVIATDEAVGMDAFAVLAVTSPVKGERRRRILDYVRAGGSVFVEADIAEQLLGVKVRRIYIKYLSSYDDKMFSFLSPCDLDQWCTVASGAEYVSDQRGRKTVAVLSVGKGTAVVLPSGLTAALMDFKIRRRNFPSSYGKRFPSERVSRVSKGAVRYLIERALMHLYWCRGLPFVHLWYFPDGGKSLFSFRVDTDFSRREDVETLYRVCRKHGIRATWFVETKTQAEWIPLYRGMENQEIGYHCYRHRVFSDVRSNQEDIRRGLAVLKKAGMVPAGYAAPYGEWHPVLGRAIQAEGFTYSSEFGVAYDTFPFFPHLGESFSTVLQVPIHPVSVGRLGRTAHNAEEMVAYYRHLVAQRMAVHKPLCVYHHPSHGRFAVFDRLFQEIREQRVSCMSLGEYADWWRRRSRIAWDARIEKGQLVFDSFCKDSSFWLRACLPEGEVLLNPITRKVDLRSWESDLLEISNKYVYNPELLRKHSWHMLMDDALHHYRKRRQ